MDYIHFKSTVQIPESIRFQPLALGDYFRSGDHLRYNVGIISGPGITYDTI